MASNGDWHSKLNTAGKVVWHCTICDTTVGATERLVCACDPGTESPTVVALKRQIADLTRRCEELGNLLSVARGEGIE